MSSVLSTCTARSYISSDGWGGSRLSFADRDYYPTDDHEFSANKMASSSQHSPSLVENEPICWLGDDSRLGVVADDKPEHDENSFRTKPIENLEMRCGADGRTLLRVLKLLDTH